MKPNGSGCNMDDDLFRKYQTSSDRELLRESKEMNMRYSLPTLMGNWLDNAAVREEKLKAMQKKFERCEFYYERKIIVEKHLYFPIDIFQYYTELMYEVPIQIASGQNDIDARIANPRYVLTTIITEREILDGKLELDDGCCVTVSRNKGHLRRNVFCIISADGKKKSGPVCFGDEIYIRIADSGSKRSLYLGAEMPTVDSFSSKHFPVYLRESVDRFCKFRAQHYNPKLHIETHGKPILLSIRLAIMHILSNRMLAFEDDQKYTTISGPENMVSVYTFKDKVLPVHNFNLWFFSSRPMTEEEKEADKKSGNERLFQLLTCPYSGSTKFGDKY